MREPEVQIGNSGLSEASNKGDESLGGQAKSVMKKLLAVAGIGAGLYAGICGVLFAVMLQSPDIFARTMRHVPWPAFVVLPFKSLWMKARSGHVSVGDVAPDFSVESAGPQESFSIVLPARTEAGCARLRQLHLTAISAGGSRLK